MKKWVNISIHLPLPPKVQKFNIIYELSNNYNIHFLCKIAKVSVSWYYKHRKLIIFNNTKELREKTDLEIINNMFLKFHKKHWYRMITMDLQWNWIIMNSKKVRRIMKKYWLVTQIRIKKHKRTKRKIWFRNNKKYVFKIS